jgi:hypothetical protein
VIAAVEQRQEILWYILEAVPHVFAVDDAAALDPPTPCARGS